MRKRSGRILWLPYMVWRRYYTGGSIFEGKEGKKKEKANEKQILSIVEIIILSYNKSSNYFLVCIVEEEFAIIIAKVTNL